MQLSKAQVGQKVRVVGTSLFYSSNLNREGVVNEIDGEYVYVTFDDGDEDHGFADDLELLGNPEPVLVKEDITVKQAIANVEAALAVLKALVG